MTRILFCSLATAIRFNGAENSLETLNNYIFMLSAMICGLMHPSFTRQGVCSSSKMISLQIRFTVENVYCVDFVMGRGKKKTDCHMERCWTSWRWCLMAIMIIAGRKTRVLYVSGRGPSSLENDNRYTDIRVLHLSTLADKLGGPNYNCVRVAPGGGGNS